MDLKGHILGVGRASGLEAIGVTTAAPFVEVSATISARVSDGMHGGMAFTFADPATATDVRATYRWARSIVVGARSYLPDAGRCDPTSGLARIARFAVDDPYLPLRAALESISNELRSAGHQAEVLADDNRLVDRAGAVRAGLGWWGKNTMLLTPAAGPWLVLGSVITDADLEADEPMIRDCGTCSACLPACPTGALVAPGVLDARRCLAAIAQAPGWIPVEFRAAMGDRLYGCDDCLEACPPGRQRLETGTEVRGLVDPIEVLGSSDDTLRARFGHFYFPKHDPDFLRRNALVILGNSAHPNSVGVLAGFLGHRAPVLRGHAGWALGQIRSDTATAALAFAARGERDDRVRAEIEAALE